MLKARLSPINRCDLIVGDRPLKVDKPLLIIGDHLKKPFSRDQLFSVIGRFDKLNAVKASAIEMSGGETSRHIEDKISDLAKRYAKELLELLRQS
jgi:uncharacterized protein Yka (UPF0111/DUF47 family)